VVELRGALETQACDCSWAKPWSCGGSDGGGCYSQCCAGITPASTAAVSVEPSTTWQWTTLGPLTTTEEPGPNDIPDGDGGQSECNTFCGCSWANAFVCSNNKGNCCAEYCCSMYRPGGTRPSTSTSTPQPSTTTTVATTTSAPPSTKATTAATTTAAPTTAATTAAATTKAATTKATTTEAATTAVATTTAAPAKKQCDGCSCDCSSKTCNGGDNGDDCCSQCCCGGSAPAKTTAAPAGRGALFCFMVMRPPPSNEPDLVKLHLSMKAGIFACDEHAVYSNKAIDLGSGEVAIIVDSNLKCKSGGEFKTALNLDIFLKVWERVFQDGTYKNYDWSVKVDPDSVFFPERLRLALYEYGGGSEKVYLNNCKFGLHGPLEVFSRTAVEAWKGGRQKCLKHFDKVCSGPCYWGEDMFIDQCMEKVLKVSRDSDYSLLVEEHCDAPKGWRSCKDKSIVAFHPFKEVDSWRDCWENSQ